MTQQATIYGTDLAQVTQPDGSIDLDPGMSEVTGLPLFVQRCVRRLTTPRGSVVDCPNDCIDLRSFMRGNALTSTPANLQIQVQREMVKEQGVLSCVAGVTYQSETLTVSMQLTTAFGPLTLTLALSPSTIAVILNGLPVGF